MKLQVLTVPDGERLALLQKRLQHPDTRLGSITSVDGRQIVTLILNTESGDAELWYTPMETNRYHSLTAHIAQAHWQERTLWDMFGLIPEGHPRLKHNLLHESYRESFFPLLPDAAENPDSPFRTYSSMRVSGSGIYEIPVGPIHAGIIEPGHFHFSCLGEVVYNLEIRLGYLHRGIEKRMTEVPWKKLRFLAESAASDSAVAYALANATALENSSDIAVPERALYLRSLALEIERVAMHVSDLGGLAGDIGYQGVAASLSRLRGVALGLGELLSGSRLIRGFVCPGGVLHDPDSRLAQIQKQAVELRKKLAPPLKSMLSNQVSVDRFSGVGRVSKRLAFDFGLTGPSGRASDQDYDARSYFAHGVYPRIKPAVAVEPEGDILSRSKVRIGEIEASLTLIEKFIDEMPAGKFFEEPPEQLKKDSVGVSVVEAYRGELIHMVFTDADGAVKRYAIKDPSVNNWTALAIAVRNNLLADFPLCNKSFALSYGGHDL
ncbi:MAG: NADH-quinone oxidoreductase subunit C [Cyanobacteria bacterium SZAS LIN-5]|nr:NADH-quinone oxidoreductase subunit C [Cyanobacteria bacterium SZAS LIN-5]